MTGVIATIPRIQFFDTLGAPLAGGKLYTYVAGSTTPVDTFQDQALTAKNENPVPLDSTGSCAIWLDPSKSYKFVLKNKQGVTQPGWPIDNVSGASNLIALQPTLDLYAKLSTLAEPAGSELVGFLPNGSGATQRAVQDKLRESVSVKDFDGKVDGTTDDTVAISAARAAVAPVGGTMVVGGKTAASGFWENLAPLAMEWVKGLPTAYATDVVSSKPVVGGKLFNGTPTAGAGYAGYGMRMDAYTKGGVDVASTVTGMFAMQAYSTNSSGGSPNNTNQVALVANSSAMDASSSAPVTAFNAITHSSYSGALAQQVVGIEVDVSVTNPVGWYGDAGKAYTVGCSVALGNGADGTVAYGAGTSSGTYTWWHGMVLSGMSHTGLTVARDGARVPETGVWVSGAQTFGIYVGAKNKHQLNPGSIANYSYRPTIGIALGQEGATSANSQKMRFVSTDGASAEYATDVYTIPGGNVQIDFGGTTKFSIASFDGSVAIQGVKVLGTRDTGWGTNTGTTSKAGFDTGTVSTAQLAQVVAALIQAMKNHGLIGP